MKNDNIAIPDKLQPYYKKDCIAVCIASGPSLTQDQIDILGKYKEEQQQQNKDDTITVITVNDNWRWKYNGEYISDLQYAADDSWWNVWLQKMRDSGFDRPCFIPLKHEFAKKNGLNLIPCEHSPGLGKNKKIHTGQNSGYQAINIAYYVGARKIILLGYDMKVGPKGKIHWFGSHPKGLRNTPNRYGTWVKNFDRLSKDIHDEGVDIVNCSLETDIKKIRRGDLKRELLSN